MGEMYIGVGLIGFCGIIMGWVFISCFISPMIDSIKFRIKKFKQRNTKDISMEELMDWLDQVELEKIIVDYAQGKGIPVIKAEDQSDYVDITFPCVGYECACSPQREDCCFNGSMIDGKFYCKVKFNLGKLCGVEVGSTPDGKPVKCETVNNINLLTPEEIDALGKYVIDLVKNHANNQI